MHYALIALIKSDKTVQCGRALMHSSCTVIMTAREIAIKTMIIFPTKVLNKSFNNWWHCSQVDNI